MGAEGYVRIQGRVDDVVNVSGHRLSTIEVESALVEHPLVAEAGAVGVAHPMTGQAVAVFVVPVTPPEVDSPAAWSEFAQRAGGPRAPGAAGTDRSAGPRRRSGRARR